MMYSIKTAKQFGAILRGFRKQQAMKQIDLAGKTGLPQSRISTIEDDPSGLSFERVLKILSALNLELVVRERKPQPDKSDW